MACTKPGACLWSNGAMALQDAMSHAGSERISSDRAQLYLWGSVGCCEASAARRHDEIGGLGVGGPGQDMLLDQQRIVWNDGFV